MTPFNDISYEEKLLISLCRLSFTEAQKKNIRELAKKIDDVDRFAWLANEHGVIALIYNNLKKANISDRFPGNVMTFFEKSRLKSIGRNTFLFNILDILITRNS